MYGRVGLEVTHHKCNILAEFSDTFGPRNFGCMLARVAKTCPGHLIPGQLDVWTVFPRNTLVDTLDAKQYGVATMSGRLKITGLFCKRAL